MTIQTVSHIQLAAIKVKLIWIQSQENEPNYINHIVMVN